MKPPIFAKPIGFKSSARSRNRNSERGVTIVLVAFALVAIMGMAALSIDVVTLYLANAEAQRSADAAALAGARILSITGMTGDPTNSSGKWAAVCDFASKVAIAVAEQNTVGGTAPTGAGQVTVTFPNNSDIVACNGTTNAFGVNPLVTVKVQRTDMPTFFSRVWGRNGTSVSATATAEAFNSSGSDAPAAGNGGTSGVVTPVQPRCVKPWIVPNSDPGNGGFPFVQPADGSIRSPGVRINSIGAGEVGETFNLKPDCFATGASCALLRQPISVPAPPPPGSLDYLPGEVLSASTAVPSCATTNNYQEAIAGCDQTTVYQCGVNHTASANPNRIDLSENPAAGDTSSAVQCLINQAAGQDTLDISTYPYRFQVGAGNPLIGSLAAGSVTTSSPSIVSLPIFDPGTIVGPTGTTDVTIVGFLQVFINADNGGAGVNVTVMNVTGCGNGTNAVGAAVSGTSPVPVRLITYP